MLLNIENIILIVIAIKHFEMNPILAVNNP